jgi:hypothetical protein
MVIIVFCLALTACAGDFSLEEVTETCQQTLSDELDPDSGIAADVAINNFLDCEGITWADLIGAAL